MSEPRLQITAIFSLLIHIAFLVAAIGVIKQTKHFISSAPYIVNLVSPETEKTETAENAAPAPAMSQPEVKKDKKISEDTKQYIANRIAAIEATKKAKRIVKLRKIISLSGSAPAGTSTGETQVNENEGTEDALTGYIEKIGSEIRARWAYPETEKDLEAVISITIMKNGAIKINNIEKSSGNPLFDRSVLSAINKGPVSPPPYEMEIGLRFTP